MCRNKNGTTEGKVVSLREWRFSFTLWMEVETIQMWRYAN